MAGHWVWRPPPGWPTPPPGWVPPPGWAPPANWPAPPEGWTWWEKRPTSPARFHLLGFALLMAGLVGWWVATIGLGFWTADCGSLSPGNPVLLHVGVAAAGCGVVAVAARWARRARQLAFRWQAWAMVAAVAVAALVYVAASVRVTSCPFVF